MPSSDPVLRKPAPLQHASNPATSNLPSNIDRPLPPLPPLASGNRLQKSDLPKRHGHKISGSTADLPSHSSLLPPPIIQNPAHVQSTTTSRPTSSGSDSDGGLAKKLKKRSSWLPGSRSRSRNRSQEIESTQSAAWIRQGGTNMDYSLRPLVDGQKIPELWTEDADCLIYLFPPSSSRAASFRLPSHLLSSSSLLLKMMQGNPHDHGHHRQRSLGAGYTTSPEQARFPYGARPLDTPPVTPQQYPVDRRWAYDEYGNAIPLSPESPSSLMHLYFPTGILVEGSKLSAEEKQRLVDVRNLFAFLTQQPLLRTPSCKTSFEILMRIADNLKSLEFNNIDGLTFGEAAATAFEFYLREMRLADVRESRERTLESLVLAEAMRSTELYNEAFAHAVGRYDSIKKIDLPIYNKITQTTRNRIERSQIELKGKQASIALRLSSFDFPSLFAGIAASTTCEESKIIPFNAWKLHFQSMRKFVMKYYKDLHGAWPPKANSKKNQFVEGGLSRLVVSMLYKDLCQLYSLLVDRSALTTRSDDVPQPQVSANPIHAALRKLLSEYDHSSPPVQPAVPFDVPMQPTIASVDPAVLRMSKTDQYREEGRKLKSNESTLILTKSHNLDADIRTSFVQAYKEFEYDQVANKTAQEMAEMRCGHWIFLYAVIQSLPLLVIDAPGVRFTEGVEYFLCQPAVGGAPWVEDAAGPKRALYRVQNGQGMVSLPSDLVDHGVEAVYHRSYCWQMATRWLAANTTGISAQVPPIENGFDALSPLEPPPGFAGGQFGVRPQSRGRTRGDGSAEFSNGFASLSLSSNTPGSSRHASIDTTDHHHPSIALGLEKLPVPGGQEWNGSGSPVTGSFGNGGYGNSRDGSPIYHSHSRNGSMSYQSSGFAGSEPSSMTTSGAYGASGTSSPRKPSNGSGSAGAANPGTTFDDILSSIANEKPADKGKKGKKK